MFRNAKTRLGLGAIAAMCAVSLVPAAAQAKHHPKPKCQPKSSHLVVQNGYARVYTKGNAAYVCIKSNGRTSRLNGANAADQFALGGRYVGFTNAILPDSDPGSMIPPHSVVNVIHIPDHRNASQYFPFGTGEKVNRLVVASDGAAAWSMTPAPGGDQPYTTVQGTDRGGHTPDQFSDDHADTIGTSLRLNGKKVTWRYTDGTTGSRNLF
jgi:hypothetical protein